MGETGLWGKLGLVLMGGAMLSKSLIQFSIDGWGSVPSQLFDLRPNHGRGDEDNGNLLQKVLCIHCCTQCPGPCRRPPSTHASTIDSWTLAGKSGSVSCGVTAPFSWVLVCTGFCLCPPRASPVCTHSGSSMVRLLGTSSKKPYATHRSGVPRAPSLRQATTDLHLHRRHWNTQTRVWLSVCGVSWCTQASLWALWASLVGLILNAISPLLPSCWGSSFALGHSVSFFLVGPNILLSMVVQQRVVTLEFSQGKMSAYPCISPS